MMWRREVEMEIIPMRVELKILGTWRDVANAARTTIGQEAGEGEPSSKWKRRMLLAEHSPIRKNSYQLEMA